MGTKMCEGLDGLDVALDRANKHADKPPSAAKAFSGCPNRGAFEACAASLLETLGCAQYG